MTTNRSEITWSIMHPVTPDAAYMRDVIAAAQPYRVDSFEICGDVHGSGGNIDGAIRFRDYPVAAAAIDTRSIDASIARLREVVNLAHASGRPVYYWHREVMVPRSIVQRIPGLLDENGEFDLLGNAYRDLLRSKVNEFFDCVPEMDGLVLTLTESDYSVIHNSEPDRYPPPEVVRNVLATFAEELGRRGKRFILRSFGSIAQDYEDILAGAAMVGGAFPFEVETKITPYDFSPFLAFNEYLRQTNGCTLGAEYDSIGEFLGAGFLPAPDPARVIASVNFARARGVHRHVIRVDRIGNATAESEQAIHLLAFDRAIADPNVSADAIWAEWAAARWPGCEVEMTALMQRGIEVVKKTHFIDGHVIFHAFPIQPEMKWLKACGILSIFTQHRPLSHHQGMWGILTDRTTPARERLLREKDEAVAMADASLRELPNLRDRLPEREYLLALQTWTAASVAARAIRHWCRAVCAYFEDMEQGLTGHPKLAVAISEARADFQAWLPALQDRHEPATAGAPVDHAYGYDEAANDSIESAYLTPIWTLIGLLTPEFDAEAAERERWNRKPGVVDYIVCGGFIDDIRVVRYMHASHARVVDGRPVRQAGNRVFPNGFMEVRLRRPARGGTLLIKGTAGPGGRFRLSVDGQTRVAQFSEAGEFACDLDASAAPADAGVVVRIQKLGAEYPAIHGLGVIATS